MKQRSVVLALRILLVLASMQALSSRVMASAEGFAFPLVNPRHDNMQRLLINAMAYLKPEHGLVDPASGYPVEGWNKEPQRGLYLRSFTQLTAIGQRLELLANIAAGYADNPYISRTQALDQLELMLASLLADQNNPQLSASGLLSNFLGFDATGRTGPLSEEVHKQKFVETFGAEQADAIWTALSARGWIVPQQDGAFARIPRKGEYGDGFFTGALAPFSENPIRAQIMALLDTRVVQIIFGDNANLTASAAKAIGALLHPSVADDPRAASLRDKLEQFIANQEAGYRQLYDKESGTFYFGWNATHDRYTGWEGSSGDWIVGHMDYLVNEFRGPLQFVVQRFGLPTEAVRRSGFKIKPYRMADGRDIYTLATWNGSAFESLGLSLFMREMDVPGWRENLENSVAIELDFANRHKLPGFLTEAYSGTGVDYTGDIGISEVAVTSRPRITDAPSLYMLGTAYTIAPESVEGFLGENRERIEGLFTEHGPWEGYNTTRNTAIEFQTTAHTLALILGGMGSAEQNMQRYLAWKRIDSKEHSRDHDAAVFNFLADGVQWIPWSPTGDTLEMSRGHNNLRISADALRNGAVTVKLRADNGVNLSNGALLLRYRSTHALEVVMTLVGGPTVFQNQIFARFAGTTDAQDIRIPLPETPGLETVTELVIHFGDQRDPVQVDLALTRFEFVPAP